MQTIKYIAMGVVRLVLGLTFLFSGVVKLIDPHGTQYKIEDYGSAFGLSAFLPDGLPLALACALAMMEFQLGIYLLLGIRRRLASTVTVIFLMVMTPLTLYLALRNPVTDCGCFGDALVLTNWQTFLKNIVLLACACLALRYYRWMPRLVTRKNQWTVALYSFAFSALFAGYNLWQLPLIDFRPYHIGADIRQAWYDDQQGSGQFQTTFIMEKDGVQQEFTLEDYPDSTWTFVDTRTVESEPAKHTGVGELIIQDASGDDITEAILADEGYTFLLVAPYLEKADDGVMGEVLALYDHCMEAGYAFYCLTASGDEAIRDWKEMTGAEYPFCTADAIVLKTMIRSNPGLMLLHDGRVVAKWPASSFPWPPQLEQQMEQEVSSVEERIAGILCWYILPMMLFLLIDAVSLAISKLKIKHTHTQTPIKTTKNMRKKIVAGNWKMNKTLQEGVALATELKDMMAAEKPNCEVIIGTPFIHLATLSELLKDSVIAVSAENCANKESGAYTGEVSAAMVKSTGAEYVILGHSERREYYHETPEILKEKVDLALANGLKVIFCIGESLAEREANQQEAVCKAELEGSVFHLSAEQWKNIVIAYEPIWAIGTGKTATAEQAEEIHAYIRRCVADVYGAQVADETSILYGGSCKASNAPELFGKPDIDGGLIGGASLKAPDFKGIIDAWK